MVEPPSVANVFEMAETVVWYESSESIDKIEEVPSGSSVVSAVLSAAT
jgi:hypothetical protein